MSKKLEHSFGGGFVHPLTQPVASRYSPHTRILEGGHYLLEQRQIATFRSVINEVMRLAEINVDQAIRSGELSGEPKVRHDTIAEILVTAANVQGIIGKGSKVACEGSSIIYVNGEDSEVLQPVIISQTRTLLGEYVAPLYKQYFAATPEAIQAYTWGDADALGMTRSGGVLLLHDATIFDTASGQNVREYERAIVPLNEPSPHIYHAIEI